MSQQQNIQSPTGLKVLTDRLYNMGKQEKTQKLICYWIPCALLPLGVVNHLLLFLNTLNGYPNKMENKLTSIEFLGLFITIWNDMAIQLLELRKVVSFTCCMEEHMNWKLLSPLLAPAASQKININPEGTERWQLDSKCSGWRKVSLSMC